MPIEIGSLKLFTIKELESLLKVSRNTVQNYLKIGKLKGRKLGVKWFVSEDNLREYFAQRTEHEADYGEE